VEVDRLKTLKLNNTKYFKLTVHYFFKKFFNKNKTYNVSGYPCTPLKTNKENIKIKN
jgi:hypothetical protein